MSESFSAKGFCVNSYRTEPIFSKRAHTHFFSWHSFKMHSALLHAWVLQKQIARCLLESEFKLSLRRYLMRKASLFHLLGWLNGDVLKLVTNSRIFCQPYLQSGNEKTCLSY